MYIIYKQIDCNEPIVVKAEHIVAVRPLKDNSGRASLLMINGQWLQIDERWQDAMEQVFDIPPSVWIEQ